jgi:competence protein ComEA
MDINSASYDDLVSSRLISPGLGKNIISYRDEHGPFRSLEELKEVKGIGEYRYNKLKMHLRIE